MPRETAVTIRMSFEEKETLQAIAKTEGLSLSEFLRDVALGVRVEKPAVPYETEQDKANKAKVRRAVENEEPYEVKVEPETADPRSEARQKEKVAETWIVQRTNELALRMPKRRALAQANMEWSERS